MTTEELEQGAKEHLRYHSVSELPDCPFAAYADFRRAYDENRAWLFVSYTPEVNRLLSGRVGGIMHKALLYSPAIVAIVLVVFGLLFSNYWLFALIPAAIAAQVFASGSLGLFQLLPTLLLAVPFGIHGFLQGNIEEVKAAFSVLFAQFAASAALGMNQSTVRELALRSETLFLWLYQKGRISVMASGRSIVEEERLIAATDSYTDERF
jgi:hypothetical protein